MKLTERVTKAWHKHEGIIALFGMAALFSTFVAISESQKIGCYRPEELSCGMTSYCAYQKGQDHTVLYPPFIIGMGHGGWHDTDGDGKIDVVGTLGYSRCPPLFSSAERVPEDYLRRIQREYEFVMSEIRKSAK
jgi:hypothetical protein